jgi:hypothetical protein
MAHPTSMLGARKVKIPIKQKRLEWSTRLLTAGTSGCGSNCWGDTYTYDPWGNLTAKTVTQGIGESFSATVNGSNQLVGRGYDSAGNLDGTPTQNTYNAENQWTYQNVYNVTYLYDGDGRRVKSSGGASGTRIYVYDTDGRVQRELDQNGTVVKDYFYLGNERLGRVTPTGIYFYYNDYLGNPRYITDRYNTCYDADYFPWGGEQYVATNSCPQNYKFTDLLP